MSEQYKNRKCGNCKYYGEHLKDDLHHCNNDKSIYKACYEMATGCNKFEQIQEEAESEDKE